MYMQRGCYGSAQALDYGRPRRRLPPCPPIDLTVALSAPNTPRTYHSCEEEDEDDETFIEEAAEMRKPVHYDRVNAVRFEHRKVNFTQSAENANRYRVNPSVSADARRHHSEQHRRNRHLMTPQVRAVKSQEAMRSQSFRHRTATQLTAENSNNKENGIPSRHSPRRRSTPNVHRKGSSSAKSKPSRTDQWPEAPQPDLLPLPNTEDYSRLRQFDIDKKGCVINRGDSFRRRGSSGSYVEDVSRSRTGSNASQVSDPKEEAPQDIMVLGSAGTGKSSLIDQFMSSEHRNPFATDPEHQTEHSVSVLIEGEVTEFIFFEAEPNDQIRLASSYLIVYSVDSRTSFRHASSVLTELKQNHQTRTKPVVIAGNKVDLARKRVVSADEANALAKQFGCAIFEVSIVLNHGVDDLLVGLLAEIQQSRATKQTPNKLTADEGFTKSMRRFSQRRGRKHETGSTSSSVKSNKSKNGAQQQQQTPEQSSACANLVQRLNRFFKRRGSRSVDNLLQS